MVTLCRRTFDGYLVAGGRGCDVTDQYPDSDGAVEWSWDQNRDSDGAVEWLWDQNRDSHGAVRPVDTKTTARGWTAR